MEKKHYKKYYGYYKKNKQNIIRCAALFLVLFVSMYMLHFIIAIRDNRGFYASLIGFVLSWYYIFEVLDVIRLQKTAKVNEYGRKCIVFHRYLSIGALIFSAFSLVFSLYYVVDYNIVLIIYVALVFVGIAYFTMLFIFEEDFYYSGGFKVPYSEINHIEVEDEVHTTGGIVVVCKLMKDDKIVGYDRMVVKDYISLQTKIDEYHKKSF